MLNTNVFLCGRCLMSHSAGMKVNKSANLTKIRIKKMLIKIIRRRAILGDWLYCEKLGKDIISIFAKNSTNIDSCSSLL